MCVHHRRLVFISEGLWAFFVFAAEENIHSGIIYVFISYCGPHARMYCTVSSRHLLSARLSLPGLIEFHSPASQEVRLQSLQFIPNAAPPHFVVA